MSIFCEELKRDFPTTPDRFRDCVSRAVAEQMTGQKQTVGKAVRGRRFSITKTLIPVAACLALLCGTAVAAGLPVFQRWLEGLGVNRQTAEELIMHGPEEIMQGPEGIPQGPEEILHGQGNGLAAGDLFTVTDAYFDGATLMFWAVPGETLDTLDFADHVDINGSDSRLEYVAETEPGSGIYECKVTVIDENLMSTPQDALDVTVQVYLPETGRQEVSFQIASDKICPAEIGENQVLELSYGTVEVRDLSVAPSSVKFNLKWKVYSEDIRNLLYIPNYFVEDSSGVRRKIDEVMRSTGVSVDVFDEAVGCWEFEQEFEFASFDSSSEYMILIPCEDGCDETGNLIHGMEAPREDMSFKVMLKKE